VHDRHRGFGSVVGRYALDCDSDDVARTLVGFSRALVSDPMRRPRRASRRLGLC
jgi:hypothetical protein